MNVMLKHYLDFIKNEKNKNLEEVNTHDFISNISKNYPKISILKNEPNKIFIRKNQIKLRLLEVDLIQILYLINGLIKILMNLTFYKKEAL